MGFSRLPFFDGFHSPLDLSIRADRLNIDQVYLDSGEIRVECILSSGKIRADVFRFYGFRINPMGLEPLFCELFFFFQNQKFCIFINQNCHCLMKKHNNCMSEQMIKSHLIFGRSTRALKKDQ